MRKKERNWDESNEAFNSIDLTVKLEEKFACMKTADCLLEFDMAIWTIRCQVNILTIRINLYLLTVLLRQFDFGNGIIKDILFYFQSRIFKQVWNCRPFKPTKKHKKCYNQSDLFKKAAISKSFEEPAPKIE